MYDKIEDMDQGLKLCAKNYNKGTCCNIMGRLTKFSVPTPYDCRGWTLTMSGIADKKVAADPPYGRSQGDHKVSRTLRP